MLPSWKNTVIVLLAFVGSVISHAGHDHDDEEIVPEEHRKELLKKWEQEVDILYFF